MRTGRPKKDTKNLIDLEREEKATQYAKMIIDGHKSIREVAAETGASKSTVHKYVKTYIDSRPLMNKVNKELQSNFNSKHLKGGEATKKKYAEKRENSK